MNRDDNYDREKAISYNGRRFLGTGYGDTPIEGKNVIRGTSADGNVINDLTINFNISIDGNIDLEKLKDVMSVIKSSLPSQPTKERTSRWSK